MPPRAIEAITLARVQGSFHIENVALQHPDMLVIVAEHIGQVLALLAVGQNVVGLQEGRYLAQRQGWYGISLVFIAVLGRETDDLFAP